MFHARRVDVSAAQPGAPALSLVFHFAQDGDNFTATVDSPDQGAYGIPFDSSTLVGSTMTLAATSLGFS